MEFSIRGYADRRVKVRFRKTFFTEEEALKFIEFVKGYRGVSSVKLYDRIGEMVIRFSDNRFIEPVLDNLGEFSYEDFLKYNPPAEAMQQQRDLLRIKKRIRRQLWMRYVFRHLIPRPLRLLRTFYKTAGYVKAAWASIRAHRLDVSILDAVAILTSVLRRDMKTANSIMFLLQLGDSLEEYTHKKAISELSRSLALNIETVWRRKDGVETEIPFSDVQVGDELIVRAGYMIPCDGVVATGLAMVNQSTLTGESVPVEKGPEKTVYAGTVVEEGELTVKVQKFAGQARIDEIIQLIDNSEKTKSKKQIQAYTLADRLVKYSFLGFGLTYVLTRNLNKALSFLMVDYSCALKVTTPIAVMAAMRECSDASIMVKGGRYMEELAEANVFVFDKTGTLTESVPTVKAVTPLHGYTETQILRIAACLEEHFPHSIANAVVRRAAEDDIDHEEFHLPPDYIVAHGIASSIDGERVVIGSAHFVFDDEGVARDEAVTTAMADLPPGCSYLFLALGGRLIGIISIEDPLRHNAREVIARLKAEGVERIVMLTGDNEMTAKVIAEEIGVDEYVAQVLPADKCDFVEREQAAGHTVVMIGDGVNDSPALSMADVGISMGSGSDIAREVADILIRDDDLSKLLFVRRVALALDRRIRHTYGEIVGFNTLLIGMGLFNLIMPNTSALLHNAGTVVSGLRCMKRTQKEEKHEVFDFTSCKYFTDDSYRQLQEKYS
ncbi:MAG: heavy metal translocating P-type ATPase [Eubacteriales bacterium]|nr:heavy metal translocating P-type ATPase [Eubacteriales bacterium]